MRVPYRSVAGVIVGATLCGHSLAQQPERAGFEFAVLRGSAWEVAVTEEDIETYNLCTHTIYLTEPALARIQESSWLKDVNRTASGQRFRVQVNGNVVYTGVFHNDGLSSLGHRYGVAVALPVFKPFWAGTSEAENRHFSIRFVGDGAPDPRADTRIILTLCSAGLISGGLSN